jgi:hypothetical protein
MEIPERAGIKSRLSSREIGGSNNVATRFLLGTPKQLVAYPSNIAETAYVDQIAERSVLAVRHVLVRLVRHLAPLPEYLNQY